MSRATSSDTYDTVCKSASTKLSKNCPNPEKTINYIKNLIKSRSVHAKKLFVNLFMVTPFVKWWSY